MSSLWIVEPIYFDLKSWKIELGNHEKSKLRLWVWTNIFWPQIMKKLRCMSFLWIAEPIYFDRKSWKITWKSKLRCMSFLSIAKPDTLGSSNFSTSEAVSRARNPSEYPAILASRFLPGNKLHIPSSLENSEQ